MTPHIIWLASYPKSGNTWLRAFLSSLTQKGTSEIDINTLSLDKNSSNRKMFDQALGLDTVNLTPGEFKQMQPDAYRWMNGQLSDRVYCKTHDACQQLDNGEWVMAPDVTAKVVYIIRHPMDVAISLAHHNQQDMDQVIASLGAPQTRLGQQGRNSQDTQVEQHLGTWSYHVDSWTQNKLFSTCVIRFEDMVSAPIETFGRITAFLDLPIVAAQLRAAVQTTSFESMRSQEQSSGFRERPQNATSFFRSGKFGQWQTKLTKVQISQILNDHLPVMQKFGYASVDGTPLLC